MHSLRTAKVIAVAAATLAIGEMKSPADTASTNSDALSSLSMPGRAKFQADLTSENVWPLAIGLGVALAAPIGFAGYLFGRAIKSFRDSRHDSMDRGE